MRRVEEMRRKEGLSTVKGLLLVSQGRGHTARVTGMMGCHQVGEKGWHLAVD